MRFIVGRIAAIKPDCRPDLFYRCGEITMITDDSITLSFWDGLEEEFAESELESPVNIFHARQRVKIADRDEIEGRVDDIYDINIDSTYIPKEMLDDIAGETVLISSVDNDYFTGKRIDRYTDELGNRRWSFPYRLIVNDNWNAVNTEPEIAGDVIDSILCL